MPSERSMKAVVVTQHGTPEHLKLINTECPKPQRHQVLIKMHATSVNFADIKARRAPYRHFQAPFVPGFDGVGEIVALGSDASDMTDLSLGQRVAAYVKGGSYAEYAVADAILCYPLPQEVRTEDAIGIGVAITAYNALQWAARIRHGESILIHSASGGVGSTALQLAKIFGASKRFVTVGKEQKYEACRIFEPDWMTTTKTNFAKEILEQTEDHGVDIILDTIGGLVLEESFNCLADFGRIVCFGHSSGTNAHISSKPLHRHNRAIIGYSSGGYRKAFPEKLKATADAVIQLWKSKELYTLSGGSFPLRDAALAHEIFERGENIGKIMLVIES